MSIAADLRRDLAAAGLSPSHRLGQNFMIEAQALDALVAAIAPQGGTRVVEIGPGTGILTRRLLAAGAEVLAVEIDAGMCRHLTALGLPGLTLVHGDCLEGKNRLHPAIAAFAAAGPWRLGANLPYDAAIPAVLNALALERTPERIVVTVQREAAERLCSTPGSDAWGASAAVAQTAGQPRILRTLSPECFLPRPRVQSAILELVPVRRLPPGFPGFCRTLFAFRRKVLTRALRDGKYPADQAYAICQAAGIAGDRRVETLSVEELVRLHAAGGGFP